MIPQAKQEEDIQSPLLEIPIDVPQRLGEIDELLTTPEDALCLCCNGSGRWRMLVRQHRLGPWQSLFLYCLSTKRKIFDLSLSNAILMMTSNTTKCDNLVIVQAIISEPYICEATVVAMICFRLYPVQIKKVFVIMFSSNHFIKCKISHEISTHMVR